MRAIDPVADIRRRGDRLKAVQKTRRYVEMTKVGVVEQKRLLLAERWGVPTDIDQDIVNGAVGASDEFRPPPARSARACRGRRPGPIATGNPE